jgi:hypothetical protein
MAWIHLVLDSDQWRASLKKNMAWIHLTLNSDQWRPCLKKEYGLDSFDSG